MITAANAIYRDGNAFDAIYMDFVEEVKRSRVMSGTAGTAKPSGYTSGRSMAREKRLAGSP
jgi:hypothetical protein